MVGGLFRTHGLSLIRLAVLLVGDQATAEDVVRVRGGFMQPLALAVILNGSA